MPAEPSGATAPQGPRASLKSASLIRYTSGIIADIDHLEHGQDLQGPDPRHSRYSSSTLQLPRASASARRLAAGRSSARRGPGHGAGQAVASRRPTLLDRRTLEEGRIRFADLELPDLERSAAADRGVPPAKPGLWPSASASAHKRRPVRQRGEAPAREQRREQSHEARDTAAAPRPPSGPPPRPYRFPSDDDLSYPT